MSAFGKFEDDLSRLNCDKTRKEALSTAKTQDEKDAVMEKCYDCPSLGKLIEFGNKRRCLQKEEHQVDASFGKDDD